MKNILLLLVCVFALLTGCNQDHVEVWEDEKIGLYFVFGENGEADEVVKSVFGADYIGGLYQVDVWQEPWASFLIDNFGMEDFFGQMIYQALVQDMRTYECKYYLGDSSTHLRDTIRFIVGYTGVKQEKDFIYHLVPRVKKGSLENINITFQRDSMLAPERDSSDLLFNAGQVYDTVYMYIHRPEQACETEFEIKFDSVGTQIAGISEYHARQFSVTYSDALETGVDWPEEWFGEFSEEKHRFIQTIAHVKVDANFVYGLNNVIIPYYGAASFKQYVWDLLNNALEEYNATHEEKKPFTFPAESELPL